jgi:acyl carrier protein
MIRIMTENEKKMKNIFANILDIDVSNIGEKTSSENTPSWDSFNTMLIASELEEEFSVKFTMDDIFNFRDFTGMKKLLIKYGIEV